MFYKSKYRLTPKDMEQVKYKQYLYNNSFASKVNKIIIEY
jgi:hypothetical protein